MVLLERPPRRVGRTPVGEHRSRPARLHPPQGRLPQAAAPHRGAGPRAAADGRGREVLHRHPHPGLGDDEGAAVGRPRPARGTHESLRRRGRPRRRPRGRREGPRGLRGDRPPRPLLIRTPWEEPAMSTASYTVVGMTCGHCVNAVTEEVSAVPGVTAVDVDLTTGGLTVTGTEAVRSEEHTSELQSRQYFVCRLLLEKKNIQEFFN